MKKFSTCLRSARARLEITQAELASRVGMLPAQLCRIETGRTDPSVDLASRLAEALDLSLSDLLSGRFPDLDGEGAKGENAAVEVRESARGVKGMDGVILVREIPLPAAKKIRKAIARREARFDALDGGLGFPRRTAVQLAHPFIRERGGAETLARVMRASLGAGETTLPDLPGLLDLHGFRVHVAAFKTPESSASFYDPSRGTYSIAVRKGDTPERQTYRLAYELGAACVFAHGGCVAPVRDEGADHRLLRAFAAAFLMPEDGVRKVVAQCGIGRGDWTMQALLALKVRFNVSAEAFALRLEELGLVLPSLRNRFRDELRAHYAAHPESMEPAPNLPPLRDSARLEVNGGGMS